MVSNATGSASHLLNSKQQMMMLDQSKTVTECALQLVYAAKEAGGNPKVCFEKLFFLRIMKLN
jgi:talin